MKRDAHPNDVDHLTHVTSQAAPGRAFLGDGKEMAESLAGMLDAGGQVTVGNNTRTPGAKSSRVEDLKEEGQKP